MRILLVGGGQVGYYVAKNLSEDGHNIVVVEQNHDRAAKVNSDLNVQVITGNGSRPSVLGKAGLTAETSKDFPLLIACTNNDESNILACWFARKMGVKNVIARAVGLEYTDNDSWAKELGIDLLISPERSVAKEVEELLQVRGAISATELAEGKAGLYVFKMSEDSPVCGKTLEEVRKKYPQLVTLVICIKRGEQSFVPKALDTLEADDFCYTICYRDQVGATEEVFRPIIAKRPRTAVILGAGKLGCQIAKRIHRRWPRMRIKIFDSDPGKCEAVSNEYPEYMVLNYNGDDVDALKYEGIEDAVAIAATANDETNITFSILTKTLGAQKSIAIVRKSSYLDLVKNTPIDAILNRNRSLADAIIKNVRYPGSSKVMTIMDEIDAEAIEVIIPEDAPCIGKSLTELDLPVGCIVGLLERKGEISIPGGKTVLQAKDRVILFAGADIMKDAITHFGETLN